MQKSQENSAHHHFVIAATIDVTEQLARKGHQRGVVRLPAQTRVDVMEAYCANCRKSYEDVADQPCSVAVEGNEHLRGGPIGVRAKRNGAAAIADVSIVQPVIRPRPTLRPVPQPQPPARPARPRQVPARRRRPAAIPVGVGQAVALMLPFDLDATLTG
jgi:hypothetical protein